MKAPKLVKTKKSQLKVPVTTAGRKMQFYRNSNRSDQAYTYEARVILYLSFFSKKTQLLSSIINDLSKVLQMTLSLVGDFLAIENLFDLRSVGWGICNENIILFLPTSSIVLILRKVWVFSSKVLFNKVLVH